MWRRDCVAHGLSQAFQKRGLPGSALSYNGSAMTAAEIVEGPNRLSDLHQTALPYSPYMNAKTVTLWGLVRPALFHTRRGARFQQFPSQAI
jgi:hypothetical protein